MRKKKSAGWQANTQRGLLQIRRFLSDLAIRVHPTSPPSLPLTLGLPDLLIADRERQAAQEPFNLALNGEKAGNVFGSLLLLYDS